MKLLSNPQFKNISKLHENLVKIPMVSSLIGVGNQNALRLVTFQKLHLYSKVCSPSSDIKVTYQHFITITTEDMNLFQKSLSEQNLS